MRAAAPLCLATAKFLLVKIIMELTWGAVARCRLASAPNLLANTRTSHPSLIFFWLFSFFSFFLFLFVVFRLIICMKARLRLIITVQC